MADSRELAFQNEVIAELKASGWLVGAPSNYNRERALYPEDLVGFAQEAWPVQWERLEKHHGANTGEALLKAVARELDKSGTLAVLRGEVKDRGARFKLCAFKPDHEMNPDASQRYELNRLRVVPELVYSPHIAEDGEGAKKWRIDLVLFVNGIPVATLELKSSFKQDVSLAKLQYKRDRQPVDPATKKAEPLLTFKRGALVHFALSQDEVWMTTKLDGFDTYFLPFNRGSEPNGQGGKGNYLPADGSYPTAYLWREVFEPDAWLRVLGRFIHLEVEELEDDRGRKRTKETMIFPRFHQWQVVNQLVGAVQVEGTGENYLVQHSAGSGKSNSIAWTAHQLSALYKDGEPLFAAVVVVTDRKVLDNQLQETIHQFDPTPGVVERIRRDEGAGSSKSEKLAAALMGKARIIIVTIQTFPFVLAAIRENASLAGKPYAVLADEAHSSQTGSSARKLREVLMAEQTGEDEELDAEDFLRLSLSARAVSDRISYFAFTATPKSKTLELFGRRPDMNSPASATNLPEPFHVYSMRQAIEERFIIDVLQNYVAYGVAWQLGQKEEADREVDSKKAKKQLSRWVRLHPHNISQKVQIVVEHFREHVMNQLDGEAKAMLVTGSRKEAVRYKLAFDKYIAAQGYGRDGNGIQALVAFSGTVVDEEAGACEFTERSMNPGLKGRDMRDAFDSGDFQVMIVANKFQTGFDQPKLCAMYVDKRLGGVDCVQTLSRLNRTYGKWGADKPTFVLDFVNDPEEILAAFMPYYRTARLTDVSDPNLVHELEDKLHASLLFEWHEVELCAEAAFDPKSKGRAERLTAACHPGRERYRIRREAAYAMIKQATGEFEEAKLTGDKKAAKEAQTEIDNAKEQLAALDLIKKDFGSFIRFYEFISQIVDLDDEKLEKLCIYARHLLPLLQSDNTGSPVDISGVQLTHYKVYREGKANLVMESSGSEGLQPASEMGSGKARDDKAEWLSEIVARLNEMFEGELTEQDMVNYVQTIADKVREKDEVMDQVRNNTREQAMKGDLAKVAMDAVLESREAHNSQALQILSKEHVARAFFDLLYDLLVRDLPEAG